MNLKQFVKLEAKEGGVRESEVISTISHVCLVSVQTIANWIDRRVDPSLSEALELVKFSSGCIELDNLRSRAKIEKFKYPYKRS